MKNQENIYPTNNGDTEFGNEKNYLTQVMFSAFRAKRAGELTEKEYKDIEDRIMKQADFASSVETLQIEES